MRLTRFQKVYSIVENRRFSVFSPTLSNYSERVHLQGKIRLIKPQNHIFTPGKRELEDKFKRFYSIKNTKKNLPKVTRTQ